MNRVSSDFLNTLVASLREEKVQLQKQIGDFTSQDPYSDPDRANDTAAIDTGANEEERHDRIAALKNELEFKLKLVEKTLQRIANKTYGRCERCGKSIDAKRLEIMPTAQYCMACEKEREK